MGRQIIFWKSKVIGERLPTFALKTDNINLFHVELVGFANPLSSLTKYSSIQLKYKTEVQTLKIGIRGIRLGTKKHRFPRYPLETSALTPFLFIRNKKKIPPSH